ncbi:OmpA-OmpF porin, OOP family [Pseudoduganella namucuonensis]|uniref:OmpA-OmpF porin, OOP family n=2 Tax=Pseudoduganella namucuonensis TaxID=1035707 RepID=A0A1I7GBJ5_9BURK|nr:OmpA-OmpF porin, OOP family [Pseudoduganella namucuonensis]
MIASATALGGVSVAHAAEVGPYVGVGVVASEHKYNLANDTSSGDRTSDEWSGKVYGGYQFDKTFALEGGYTDFGKSGYNYSVGTANGHIDSKSHSFYVAGKASMPVNDQFSLNGKLGLAYNKNTVNGSGLASSYAVGDKDRTGLYASVGAEYAINQKVSLSLDYEHYGKNDIEQGRKKGAFSLGARYNF